MNVGDFINSLGGSGLSTAAGMMVEYLLVDKEGGNTYTPDTLITQEILDGLVEQLTTFQNSLKTDPQTIKGLFMLKAFTDEQAITNSPQVLEALSSTVVAGDSFEVIFAKETQAVIDFLQGLALASSN